MPLSNSIREEAADCATENADSKNTDTDAEKRAATSCSFCCHFLQLSKLTTIRSVY